MKYRSFKLSAVLSICILGIPLVAQVQPKTSEATVPMPQPIRLLTSDAQYDDGWPTVSPDGKRIVFGRARIEAGSKWMLWVMPLDGGAARPLSPPSFPLSCENPVWSPDGTTIAFTGHPDEKHGGIWLMSTEGTNLRRLTDEEKFDDFAPSWSPDGKWLVFSRGPVTQEWTNDLWQVSLACWQRQLTRGEDKWDGSSSVAPDGRHIAFASSRGGHDAHTERHVWIMTIDGGEATVRQFTFGAGKAPAWSPDGAWIAFASDRDGRYALYLKRVGDSDVIRATGPTGEFHPAWSPDGNKIVFNPERALGHSNIAVVDVREIVRRMK